MMPNKITEKAILDLLCKGRINLPPLQSMDVVAAPPGTKGQRRPDVTLDLVWSGGQQRFAVELKATWTPRTIDAAIATAIACSDPPSTLPMVIVPFLSAEHLSDLEQQGVSGIDLCGNGVVCVPPELMVYRTGKENQFRSSRPIRNVYQKRSSLVARVFLLRPHFDSVSEVLQEIEAHNGEMALSTVSKALTRLQDDLLITKDEQGVRLLQVDSLMDRLLTNYRRPEITNRERVKCSAELGELFMRLTKEQAGPLNAVVSGGSSVGEYATLATDSAVSIYCTKIEDALRRIGPVTEESTRFPNIELLETEDPLVYFDPRSRDGVPWASPIQTWLELATGDKREQQAAEQVRNRILDSLREAKM